LIKKKEEDDDGMWTEDEMEDFRNQFPEPELPEEWDDIDDISKEAGKMEKEMSEDEPKPLEPSDELIERLEKELEKLTGQKVENEKSNDITDDLLRKINKLSEMIDLDDEPKESEETKEEKKEIEEKPTVTPIQDKKRIVYKRRDDGRNTRFDRI